MNLSEIPIQDLAAEIDRRTRQTDNVALAAAAVIAAEAAASGISPDLIRGRCRQPHIAAARMRCMAAVYRRGFSPPQVGRAFLRTRGAVLHAVKSSPA